MPFGGGRWIRRKTLAGRKDAGETVLRDRTALPRRLAQDRGSTRFVARHPGAVVERDCVFDLAVDVAGAGGGGEPARGFRPVLRHPAPLLIKRGERDRKS